MAVAGGSGKVAVAGPARGCVIVSSPRHRLACWSAHLPRLGWCLQRLSALCGVAAVALGRVLRVKALNRPCVGSRGSSARGR